LCWKSMAKKANRENRGQSNLPARVNELHGLEEV
jgi:hypothetical protein